MPHSETESDSPRGFAIKVVRDLRAAGFEALWAGGCVRDDLLGIIPKDYDVATSATPQEVMALFGKRRTVPVGVSFGVVMVLGPQRSCGQIEVATFRSDGEYIDGRRPETVQFCSAEEDAKRRDFTINGMFYDPITDSVIDYVSGQQDLANGVVRAIGDATARFTEDKLRMLRAVRFASTYEFQLDDGTASAVRALRQEMTQVSAERIAQELRRMFSHRTRGVSLAQLIDVDLHEAIFPQVSADVGATTIAAFGYLQEATFEPSFAMLFASLFDRDVQDPRARIAKVREQCRRLKLSNEETGAICWILQAAAACAGAERQALHVIKPILADCRVSLLLDYLHATELSVADSTADSDFLKTYRQETPNGIIDPAPFINGRDLQELGVPSGPVFKELLTKVRHEQLDELLLDRDAALERLRLLYHPS